MGHSVGTCRSLMGTDKRVQENKAPHRQDKNAEGTWVRKDKPIEEGSLGLHKLEKISAETNKEVTIHNGFAALEGLDGVRILRRILGELKLKAQRHNKMERMRLISNIAMG